MKVQLHPEAEEELYQGAAWYEDREVGLGDSLLAEVARWFDVIAESPATWPSWPGSPDLGVPIRRVVMQVLELPRREHPFFIATQAHPELSSRPLRPQPMFVGLVRAALEYSGVVPRSVRGAADRGCRATGSVDPAATSA